MVKQRLLRWLRRESTLGYLLVAPLLLWIMGILAYPVVSTIINSFYDVRLTSLFPRYVGLGNYTRIFSENYGFWDVLNRTFIFTASNVVLHLVIGLIVALLMNRDFIGKSFVRIWIFIPWMIPFVVMAIMWRWMLHGSMGIVNSLLITSSLVKEPIVFLGDPQRAMSSIVSIFTWRSFPLPALVFLASLQVIPLEQYEAAAVDGANKLQRLLFVTLPNLMPSIITMSLLSTLWTFNVFAAPWLLTEGGPGNATTTLPVMVYIRGFRVFRLGEAAALSVIMLLILMVMMVVYFRVAKLDEEAQ